MTLTTATALALPYTGTIFFKYRVILIQLMTGYQVQINKIIFKLKILDTLNLAINCNVYTIFTLAVRL